MSRSVISIAVLAIVAFGAAASEKSIRKVSTVPTSPASGQEMFNEYCAVCHGNDGKGGGPAAPALNTRPTNLTELTVRNKGKFPELRVFSVIQGDSETVAHGSRDMPIWGNVFQEMSRGSNGVVQMRISNLITYIKGLQRQN